MLSLIVIAPLLCGQLITDAPERSARLTAEMPTTDSWVRPALVVTGVSFPILVGVGLAATLPVSAWSMPLMLAVGGAAAIGALIVLGAIALGHALDQNAANSKGIRPGLPVWPWVMTALSLFPVSGLFAGVGAIFGIGTVGFAGGAGLHGLVALFVSGLLLGPAFGGLLVTALVVGLVNASRVPEALRPLASADERNGLTLMSF